MTTNPPKNWKLVDPSFK